MNPRPRPRVAADTAANETAEMPFARSAAEILNTLAVTPESGLQDREVARRRRLYGRNVLREITRKSFLRIVMDQLDSVVLWLLLAAAGLSFAFTEWMQAVAILVVVALNVAIGSVTELKATRSMEALRRIGRVSTRVRRNGAIKEVLAQNLVPGDIVLLEGGDVVAADLRLIEASKLQCDESALTGESVPVSKSTGALSADTTLADRTNMAFKASSVVRGSGEGVVVRIGMTTELGRISSLVESTEETRSPLERGLDRLGGHLMWLTLLLALLISIAGVAAGKDLVLMVQTGVALAVAAVPEGLPVVATIALARGLWRMARRNALIERLAAVESLGATTVIMTDKTGTLTENRMTVVTIACENGETTIERGSDGPCDTSTVRQGWRRRRPVRRSMPSTRAGNLRLMQQRVHSGGRCRRKRGRGRSPGGRASRRCGDCGVGSPEAAGQVAGSQRRRVRSGKRPHGDDPPRPGGLSGRRKGSPGGGPRQMQPGDGRQQLGGDDRRPPTRVAVTE